MSLTRRQEELVEIALDRLETIPSGIRREPVEYILDQLVEGATPAYNGGERPARNDGDVSQLIQTLRLHMPGLPKLSDID